MEGTFLQGQGKDKCDSKPRLALEVCKSKTDFRIKSTNKAKLADNLQPLINVRWEKYYNLRLLSLISVSKRHVHKTPITLNGIFFQSQKSKKFQNTYQFPKSYYQLAFNLQVCVKAYQKIPSSDKKKVRLLAAATTCCWFQSDYSFTLIT